jgi:kynureninase|tara:strand:- start:2274 stop:3530 length:1257 start_codon:yes stop_codon:yes gene_type:complete
MKKEYAIKMDKKDPISMYKNDFLYMENFTIKKIYFCGNSLGLQHRLIKNEVLNHLKKWSDYGVDGHFIGKNPWINIQENIKAIIKDLIGCKDSEIAIMNALSVNLHLLMISFFRPSKKKNKILIEEHAFSSDRYVINSQLNYHGYDQNSIISLKPKNKYCLTLSDIIESIKKNKDSLSMVLLPGVQYYTGQFFDIKTISKYCKKFDIVFGVDLAHAIGNVKLNLNECDIDFASWCSYKYLNSGPGGISGIYINSKHLGKDISRFEGWWGNDIKTRFNMDSKLDDYKSAEGWVISNPPIILMSMHLASLKVFKKVGFSNLLKKSKTLTNFLYDSLVDLDSYKNSFEIITPENPNERGCQLSLLFYKDANKIFNKLIENNFVPDFRKPDVIRVSPVPFYNSFYQVFLFVETLDEILRNLD